MKPKVLVTREIFDDVLDSLQRAFRSDRQPSGYAHGCRDAGKKPRRQDRGHDDPGGPGRRKAPLALPQAQSRVQHRRRLQQHRPGGLLAGRGHGHQHARGPGRQHRGLHLGADPVHGAPGGRIRCAPAGRAVEGLVPQAVPGCGRAPCHPGHPGLRPDRPAGGAPGAGFRHEGPLPRRPESGRRRPSVPATPPS